jgi:hypothetical protein
MIPYAKRAIEGCGKELPFACTFTTSLTLAPALGWLIAKHDVAVHTKRQGDVDVLLSHETLSL